MRKICALILLLSISPVFAKDISVDKLLQDATTKICKDIDGKLTVFAIIDIKSDFWGVSEYIESELQYNFSQNLAETKLITRNERASLLVEQ